MQNGYVGGNIYVSGVLCGSDTAYALLRSAFPDLGTYVEIDLDGRRAIRGASLVGAAAQYIDLDDQAVLIDALKSDQGYIDEQARLDAWRNDPANTNLTPRQFNYFTARWGYDDAITAVLAALKSNDIETYALVKADVVGAKEYHFNKVLAVIGNPVVAPVIPQGVDVSAETLAERWLEAANV